MYEYIMGKVTYKGSDYLVVENNGIGFRVYTALSTLENLNEGGDGTKLYTHLYLREGVMDLYGFATGDELKMFRLLLSVSGIGPRAAVSLISAIQPTGFALAVVSDDVVSLTRAPGIGKKTAQKIILELKDKIAREQFMPETGDNHSGPGSSMTNEAVNALMVLGYTSMEAGKAVASVGDQGDTLEVTIRKALKYMAGK